MVLSADGSDAYCTCFPEQVRIEDDNQLESCKECHLSIPDQEPIYAAFKNVEQIQYVGTKGLKGKRYLITTIIEQQRYRRVIDKLIRKYGTESLSSTIQNLLESGAFSSRSAAMRLFPGLIEEAAAEEVAWESETPTADASYDYKPSCEPEAVAGDDQETKDAEPVAVAEEYLNVRDMEEKPCEDNFPAPDHDGDREDLASDKPAVPVIMADPAEVYEVPAKDATPSNGMWLKSVINNAAMQSLTACDRGNRGERTQEAKGLIYLPFRSQYTLMVQLQGVLERACFAYAQRRLSTLLRRHEWTCAEAVPLHTWMDQFSIIRYTFDKEPSKELLQSIAEIEDTAVKRTPIDWSRTKEFLDNAIELTDVLQTKEYSDAVKKIRVDVTKAIQNLRHQEQEVRKTELSELLSIYFQREELNEKEKLVQAEKERKMRECQQSAGLKVMKALEGARLVIDMSTPHVWMN